MKTFLGIFVILLILAAGTLTILAIWGLYPVSWQLIWKTGLSVLLASVIIAFVWQTAYSFLRKEKHLNDGNKAHRIN